jgi:hypothetical protein
VRSLTPSFDRMLETWLRTVPSLRRSASAISPEMPLVISFRTSRSRGVSASGVSNASSRQAPVRAAGRPADRRRRQRQQPRRRRPQRRRRCPRTGSAGLSDHCGSVFGHRLCRRGSRSRAHGRNRAADLEAFAAAAEHRQPAAQASNRSRMPARPWPSATSAPTPSSLAISRNSPLAACTSSILS